VFGQRLADPNSMRTDEIDLENACLFGVDAYVSKLADSGGDGVGRAVLEDEIVYDAAGDFDGFASVGLKHYSAAMKNDVGKDFEGEVVSGDVQDCRHWRFSVLGSQFPEKGGEDW
jgi:hypothetical protein